MASARQPIATLQYSTAKIAMVLIVTLVGFVFAVPNLLSEETRATLPDWMTPMQLGLDLQGGSYLLLEVDLEAVEKEQLTNLEETVRGALRDQRLGYRNLRATETEVFVTIPDDSELSAARTAIRTATPEMEIDSLDDS